MSRIGRQPILIPEGVTVKISGRRVVVVGPKGRLEWVSRPEIQMALDGRKLVISRKRDDRLSSSLHGLTRALVANMVTGVTEGYSKVLKLVGTGYRARQEADGLVLSVGFSHPVTVKPIRGINLEIKGNDTIAVSGIDKALVGQVAAKIRAIRPPEPYKGKGIRYEDEEVKRKPGKAGKVGAAGFGEGGAGE